MWHWEEQRKRELKEAADARYARLVRLNEAEIEAERSKAVGEELERARLAREARERPVRIAAYDAKHGGPRRVISGPTRVTRSGRACMETKYSDGTLERRYLEDGLPTRRDGTVLADGHERIERRNA